MLKSILLSVLLFAQIFVSGQSNFQIKGKADLSLNGKEIILVIWDKYSNNKFTIHDTTRIQKGLFSFNGRILRECEEAFIMLKEKGSFFYFTIDTGLNEIVVHPLPAKWPTSKNKLSNTKVLNSASNRISDSVRSLINTYYLKFGKPSKNNKNIIQLDTAMSKELWLKQVEIAKKKPEQYYSIILLYKLLLQRPKGIQEISKAFNELFLQIRNTSLGIELSAKITTMLSTQVGNKISEILAQDPKGNLFSSQGLLGTPYLVAFGATWCQPCKENYPVLKKIKEKQFLGHFEILTINLDEKKEIWIKQIKKFELSDWKNISELKKWEESEIAKRFAVPYLPFYLLVNKDGVIVYNSSQIKDSDLKILEDVIRETVRE
jgi:thiol-disulfide isomerase/thioredoxin